MVRAETSSLPLRILGSGSNLVVSDEGINALVIRPEFDELNFINEAQDCIVEAGAGIILDELILQSAQRGLWGLENLSGIPGTTGAAPVQNVGAYGTEISEVLEEVEVLDLRSRKPTIFSRQSCEFRYRSSLFREFPGRYLITRIRLRLSRVKKPRLHYRDLAQIQWPEKISSSLIREKILEIRRNKGMILPAEGPQTEPGSAGSFFVNPVLGPSEFEELQNRAGAPIPARALPDNTFKVPAAWLIESSGFKRGLRRGPLGISPFHSLALVHYGGGSTAQLLSLAREIQDEIHRRFCILLKPEVIFWGFGRNHPLSTDQGDET